MREARWSDTVAVAFLEKVKSELGINAMLVKPCSQVGRVRYGSGVKLVRVKLPVKMTR